MALGRKPIEIVESGSHQLLVKADTWERVWLDHVADVKNGCAFKSTHFNHNEGMPLIRIRDISKTETGNLYSGEYEEEYLVNRGDVLIGMDGDFNCARWKGKAGLLNQRVCKISPTTDLYSDKFLYLCLQPYLNAINEETSSITVKHLSSRTIQEIPLPLPPLSEQHRIVAKIEELFSELDKGIESLKTAREQLKVYRQALLKHAFEGKLTEQWRKDNAERLETADQLLERIKQEREARYQQQLEAWKAAVKQWETYGREGKKPSKPRKLKSLSVIQDEIQATLASLPDGWCWGKLGWMTTGVEYGTSAKSQKEGSHPVLRMGNIQNAKFDLNDLVYTSDKEEINRYLLEKGDVLFNRTNSPELVGKTAIYTENRPALFAGYLIRINNSHTVVSSQYLNLFLNSHVAKQYGNTIKTDGVNQSNINGEKLSNYPFPYCGLQEQEKIVEILDEKLSVIDVYLSDTETNLQKSEALCQSILKKAFSGQLVPQDPNDEPASVLLERIAEEKVEAVAKTKKARAAKKKTKKRNLS